MSGLSRPVRPVLRPPISDDAVDQIWDRIEQKRRAPSWSLRRGPVIVASVALAACVALVLGWPRAAAPGPLVLRDGSAVAVLSSSSAETYTFTDGSEIDAAPGARVEAVESSGTAFEVSFRGTATFRVHPGGPRRWSIDCDLATVEVVGTEFTLEATPAHLGVRVDHGIVLVRGERVPGRVRRLTAGAALDVDDPTFATPAPPPAPIFSATPPTTPAAPAPPRPSPARSAPPARAPAEWRSLADRGAYTEAYRSLGPEGLPAAMEGANGDDLLALADVARLAGHPRDALGPLARVAETPGGGPRAALAAFTLGRVELDSEGDPAAASGAFARAIALGLPAGLVDDAYARLIESRARAGDRDGARDAAREYAERFPDRSLPPRVRAWTEE
jgi:transmembrane sensor